MRWRYTDYNFRKKIFLFENKRIIKIWFYILATVRVLYLKQLLIEPRIYDGNNAEKRNILKIFMRGSLLSRELKDIKLWTEELRNSICGETWNKYE